MALAGRPWGWLHLLCFLVGVALTAALFGLSPQAASRLSAPLRLGAPARAPVHRRPSSKRAAGQPRHQPSLDKEPVKVAAEGERKGSAGPAQERALPGNAWRNVVAERLAPWAATGVTRAMLDAASGKHYMSGR